MASHDDPVGGCRHDRAPLKRLGKVERGGKTICLLLCTKCGFTVSTDELRRLRAVGRVNGSPPHYCATGGMLRQRVR